MNILNEDLARNVLEVVDQGLVMGIGKPIPGKMDVTAAVCYAMGLPHSDRPTCVGRAVRGFEIRLNDSRWSSDKARAGGMRKLAIAQLGSDTIDQRAFATIVVEQTIRQIVPIALRAAAAHIPEHAERLEAVALRCENDGNSAAANAARSAANEADRFTAYPAAYPAAYAAYAAAAYAAAAYASDAAAEPAAYPAAAGAVAVADAVAARDNVLMICADIGLSALIELKSPGCRYLWLTENKE